MYINESIHLKMAYLTSSIFVAIHEHTGIIWDEMRALEFYLLDNTWAIATHYEYDFDGFMKNAIVFAPSLENVPYTKCYDMFTDVMEAYQHFFA